MSAWVKFVLLVLSSFLVNCAEDECIQIITRRNWSATPASHVDYQTVPVRCVIIAHTASRTCESPSACAEYVRGVQNYHKTSLNYNDIGYNFLIGNDGNVYEGVGWHKEGAHTRSWNKNSTGIAFIGNFNDVLPSQAALDACKKLLECGVQAGELTEDFKLLGHSQVKPTQSPGFRLYTEIQSWDNWASQA